MINSKGGFATVEQICKRQVPDKQMLLVFLTTVIQLVCLSVCLFLKKEASCVISIFYTNWHIKPACSMLDLLAVICCHSFGFGEQNPLLLKRRNFEMKYF
ncbi:lysine-specific demethylase 8 [Platysternon megacephalum]|uniref:Lysine-specific demethylase 8 n=1 Tax=Platysternon megacephalum TaxID=55544 RepID=A0A4D9EI35_9SAUR|nr:lysine-specific demethylase 8 [Platysternon megacephalum]